MEKMRVKMFTHTDLDGIACGILGQVAFKHIDIENCNYDDIDERINKYIDEKQYKNYDLVLITDIGISNETAERINNTSPEEFKIGFNLCEQFQFIDHHKTSLDMNKYYWANVRVEKDGSKDSGTSLLYSYLIENEYIEYNRLLDYFVEEVRRYDTWEWVEKYNIDTPKQLNDLIPVYGRKGFIERTLLKLKHPKTTKNLQNLFISKEDRLVLEIENRKIKSYCEKKQKEIRLIDVKGYKAGVVICEQYTNDVAHYLLDNNSKIDIALVINITKGTLSFRSRKDGVDVSEVAKLFGGGGHTSSAGSEFDKLIVDQFINKIIN